MPNTIKEQVDTYIKDFKEEFDILDEINVELAKCSSYGAMEDITKCLDEFADRIATFRDDIGERMESLGNPAVEEDEEIEFEEGEEEEDDLP